MATPYAVPAGRRAGHRPQALEGTVSYFVGPDLVPYNW